MGRALDTLFPLALFEPTPLQLCSLLRSNIATGKTRKAKEARCMKCADFVKYSKVVVFMAPPFCEGAKLPQG